MIEIVLAKSAGFCYGVKRAVELANKALQEYSEVYSGGNVVNNKQVVKDLENKGLKRFNCLNELKENSNVLIRAHGVSLEELHEYEKLRCNIVDATCPNVKRIHELVKKHANTEWKIIILGDKEHPEIVGIKSYAGENYTVINSIDKVMEYDKVCVVQQTTFSKILAQKIIDKIILASKEQIIYNTICEATSIRQKDVEDLAKTQEAVIVIGDKQSANSNRLYEISKEFNLNTLFIENYDELDLEEIKRYSRIGITAGASTPEDTIENIIVKIKEAENKKL